ncbi:MAG: winged helix DNA-binding protein [Pseudomonadota bacterium]
MNDRPMSPLSHEYGGSSPERDSEARDDNMAGHRDTDNGVPKRFSPPQDPHALTHRPRGKATLNPAAFKPVDPDAADSKDENARADARMQEKSATLATARQFSAESEGTGLGETLTTAGSETIRPAPQPSPDLQPFADQLIAIAEQLRRGVFDPSAITSPQFEETNPAFAPTDGIANPETAHGTIPTEASNAPSGISRGAGAELETLDLDEKRKCFAAMARTVYAKRRMRASIFGDPELFGEPGWDILLDLYIAHVENKPVSVSSACIGSASPPTTGLRWLGVLAEQGLLERKHDPEDQRRVLVRLTEKALSAMDTYFLTSAQMPTSRRASRAEPHRTASPG